MAEIPVSKQKIHWSNFAWEEIIMMYARPLISELENRNSDVQNVCENYVKLKSSLTVSCCTYSQKKKK